MERFTRTENQPGDFETPVLQLADNIFKDYIEKSQRNGHGRNFHDLPKIMGIAPDQLVATTKPTALQIAHAVIDAFHKELDRGYYGTRGKKRTCTFYKNAVKFIEDSGVIPRLPLYDLALYTVCLIRFKMTDTYRDQQQMMARVMHPGTISELRWILDHTQQGRKLDRKNLIEKFHAVRMSPLPNLNDKIACSNSNLARKYLNDFFAQPQVSARDERQQTHPRSFDRLDVEPRESIHDKAQPKKGIQQPVSQLFPHTNQERAEHMAASVDAAVKGAGLDLAAVTQDGEADQQKEVVVEESLLDSFDSIGSDLR